MKRFPLPDLLKGFAVFLIVPVHILETFIDFTGRESLFGKTLLLLGGPIAVPIFMMVMGYFVALNNKSMARNIRRGALIFLLGLLLNIGLNFHLLLKIYYEAWPIDPLQYIFGVDIFFLAGLSIIVLSFLKHIKRGQQWIVLSLIILVSGFTSYMNQIIMPSDRNYLLPFIAGSFSWSYFPIFPWLTYPLIGFLFQKKEPMIRELISTHKTLSRVLLVLVVFLVIGFSPFGIKTTIELSEYYHHGFSYFLWTMGVDIIWLMILWQVVKKFPETPALIFLRWLGKNITVFYVIQWLIIGNIATVIYQTQELSRFAYWFLSIFLLTTLLTWIFTSINSLHKLSIKSSKND